MVGVKLAFVLLPGLLIVTDGPDSCAQTYEVMLRPLAVMALPARVTSVPVVTVEGMLPKVTTGDDIAAEGWTAISAW